MLNNRIYVVPYRTYLQRRRSEKDVSGLCDVSSMEMVMVGNILPPGSNTVIYLSTLSCHQGATQSYTYQPYHANRDNTVIYLSTLSCHQGQHSDILINLIMPPGSNTVIYLSTLSCHQGQHSDRYLSTLSCHQGATQ